MYMTYADLIKWLWRKSGLGVQEYAEKIDFSRGHISNIINDQQPGSLKALQACLRHANIGIEDCLSPPPTSTAEKEEGKVLTSLRSLSDGNRELALKLIASLSGGQQALRRQAQRRRQGA